MIRALQGRWRTAGGALAVLAGCQAVTAQAAPVRATNDATVALAVAEASLRFGIPAVWIRHIIRFESGGDRAAVSPAGAMGLMQLMPATYAALRQRHGLGADPFAVRDNILAGTAYLRELHDRYGATGMLAAYNAGPARWEAYLSRGRSLPAETRRYLARLLPTVAVPGLARPSGSVRTASPLRRAPPIFVARYAGEALLTAPPTRGRAAAAGLSGDAAPAHASPPARPPATDPSSPSVGVARPPVPRSGALFVPRWPRAASR